MKKFVYFFISVSSYVKLKRKYRPVAPMANIYVCFLYGLKVHKIEIFFGFDFEICIISLLVMWKY